MDRRDFINRSLAAVALAASAKISGAEQIMSKLAGESMSLSPKSNNHNGKLGFGLMRLPRKDGIIDIEQTCNMVDLFLASGFTYFDTAYVYRGSEDATRQALVERHKRDTYTLATKLNVGAAASAEEARKELDISLERTKAGYFDYYLLHALMNGNYDKYEQYGLWDFVKEQKAQGRIRHYGFSFHDGPELLEKILSEHEDIDFVQLQINYADWNNPSIQSRANYELARRHGKPIVIMEPVKGGNLANPPQKVREIFNSVNPDASCASWAIRFAASLDGVLAVLSGMSNMDQMRDNVSYMKDFHPLNDKEIAAIIEARKVFGASTEIPCTACHYCTGGCPQQIAIPEIFKVMNRRTSTGLLEQTAADYRKLVKGKHSAADCIKCGQCEKACPQHIKIIDQLAKCAKTFALK